MIRLVFGLGTRAVNRVGNDYPRMIAVSHPQLRPESGARIAKYSQWEVDLIDLERNEFATRPLAEVLEGRDYPNLRPLRLPDEGRLPGGPVDEPPRDDDGGARPHLQQSPRQDRLRPADRGDARRAWRRLTASRSIRNSPPRWTPRDGSGSTSSSAGRCDFPGRRDRCNFPRTSPPEAGPLPVDPDDQRRRYDRPSATSSTSIRPRYGAIDSPEVKKSLGRIVGRINEHPAVARGSDSDDGAGAVGEQQHRTSA